MDYIPIANLPSYHPLRNLTLKEIDAEYRNFHSKLWKRAALIVISRATFNQLSGPWLECNEWRVPCSEPRSSETLANALITR